MLYDIGENWTNLKIYNMNGIYNECILYEYYSNMPYIRLIELKVLHKYMFIDFELKKIHEAK